MPLPHVELTALRTVTWHDDPSLSRRASALLGLDERDAEAVTVADLLSTAARRGPDDDVHEDDQRAVARGALSALGRVESTEDTHRATVALVARRAAALGLSTRAIGDLLGTSHTTVRGILNT